MLHRGASSAYLVLALMLGGGRAWTPRRAPVRARRPSAVARCAAAPFAKTGGAEPRKAGGADEDEVDVVVIGAGVGGLSCAALLGEYGLRVRVLESHTIAGGCAHGFERGGYEFDSGPSLWNGMAQPSTNPLRQVLDALGVAEQIEWLPYDGWWMLLPEGRQFYFRTGDPASWEGTVLEFGGRRALDEWRALQAFVRPISEAAAAIPPLVLRDSVAALIPAARFALGGLLRAAPVSGYLTGPFRAVLDGARVTSPFLRHWFAYLAFALSGLDDAGTLGAAVAYTMRDLYPRGALLEYPRGGSKSVVDTLVRAIEARAGTVQLGAHVERIEVEGGGEGGGRARATGVRLRSGAVVRARLAVVSNAHVEATVRLLPPHARPPARPGSGGPLNSALEMTPTFMHLHLGVDAAGLSDAERAARGEEPLTIHYSVILDDFADIGAPQNMVIVSIPTVLDPSLAPPGKHVVHAYYAADEEYGPWEGLERTSAEYARLKAERGANLWRALERIVPDIRVRAELTLDASPLTHERFVRRPRGTYGPTMFPADGSDIPWARTQLDGLLHCGDSCYPGIGVPAVAASGACAASTLVPVGRQLELLGRMRERGVLKP